MVEYRTRYRIVFVYWDSENGKCITDRSPFTFKRHGSEEGDSFKHWKQFAIEVAGTIPKKCIITKPTTFSRVVTGVCVIKYILKEKFVYYKRIEYVFKTRKDGVDIAYQVNLTTKKMKQVNLEYAKRNFKAQQSRFKTGAKKHIAKKKVVVDQFTLYKGCYSTDMQYMPGVRRSGGSLPGKQRKRMLKKKR